ncbi:MAG: hypothetical protein AAB660_01230 [Patescibacteria group bacterium]
MDQPIKAPLPLRVITLLGLIGATISILASIPIILLTFGTSISLVVLIALITNVFIFVSLVALRKMKRWAYHLFGVLTLVNVLMLIRSQTPDQIAEVVFGVIFFAYLWSLRSRFN